MKKTIFASIFSLSLVLSACSASDVNAIKSSLSSSVTALASVPPAKPSAAPTPVPTATPPTKFKISFRAALAKNSGDIVPVVRTEVEFAPFNQSRVKCAVVKASKAGERPRITAGTDIDLYQKELAAWENKAYAGFPAALKEMSGGIDTVKLTTDLNGAGDIELSAGTWYVTSSYKVNDQYMVWKDVVFKVNDKTSKIELSNDNGEVFHIFNDSRFDFCRE